MIISNSLKWTSHINKAVGKANSTLGFLRRNLRQCPTTLKLTAYQSLVRPLLEYSCAIWDPYLQKDTVALEKTQRRAARFICSDYRRDSSVTSMLDGLGLVPLADRRREQRLVLFFKIIKGLVAIPVEQHLEQNKSTRLRTANSQTFRQQRTNTELFRHSFFQRTTKDWNLLPDNTVCADTVESFKQRLKN